MKKEDCKMLDNEVIVDNFSHPDCFLRKGIYFYKANIDTYDNYYISKCGILIKYVVYNRFRTDRIQNSFQYKKLFKSRGYLGTMMVNRKGVSFRFSLHRLVASTFIPNHENKPYVNHIDGNKLNNTLQNLEWCTAKENANHAIKTGLTVKCEGRHVSIFNLKGELLEMHTSITKAAKKLNVACATIKLAIEKRKDLKGFKLKYIS